MSQLTSIGGLHRRRADSAAMEVREARIDLDHAEQVVVECEQRLAAHRIEAARQEREIDAGLFNCVIKRTKLDDAMIDLQIIKSATLAMETELMQTEQERDKMRIAFTNAQARYRERLVKLEKFESLIERETRDATASANAAEEATLEEAVELMQKSYEH